MVSSGVSQDFGPPQVITAGADLASCVYATDLDGDGDADVLSSSKKDDTIAWYENLGTSGGSFLGFGPQQVITTGADWAACVFAADLDGDGDADAPKSPNGDTPDETPDAAAPDAGGDKAAPEAKPEAGGDKKPEAKPEAAKPDVGGEKKPEAKPADGAK